MRQIRSVVIIFLFSLLFGIILVYAQTECDIDASEVIEVVENVCDSLDDNQVCYGNFEVGADLIDNVELPDFSFDNPGDLADLVNIKSIYLSALDPKQDTWGIAQMLLLTSTAKGTQELNLLLFGDVKVKNAVEPTLVVQVQVGIYSANIRNLPAVDSLILQSVPAGTLLEAVGRLEDGSWVRVRTEAGAVGWIATELVAPIHENETIDDLDIQDGSSPYFGAMQAFYFEQGTGSACDNITADGLIIQTPQGPASVSISINGVNIDLIPGQTGATAYVEGSSSDMTITMIGGNSYVNANGSGYYVNTGEQSTVAIGNDGTASGEPSFPTTYDPTTIDNLPNLPYVIPIVIPADNTIAADSTPNAEETLVPTGGTIDGTTSTGSTGTNGGGGSTSCEINTNSNKACGVTGNSNSNGGNGGGNGKGGGN